MKLFNRMITASLEILPESLVKPLIYPLVAKNYVAGPTIDDAVRRTKAVNTRGAEATIDHLGEEARDKREVEENIRIYKNIIRAINSENLRAGIAIKPTNFGLRFDPNFSREAMREVIAAAAEKKIFTWIDMENSSTTSATIDFYLEAQWEFGDLVGMALQAYLRRSLSDICYIRKNVHYGAPHIRLCKGIYNEALAIAIKEMPLINQNYYMLLDSLFSVGSFVGIATHDSARISEARQLIKKYEAQKRCEFQMLLGVEDPPLYNLIKNGNRGSVYIAFGVKWYGYSLRRFKENPRIVGYILENMLKNRKQK
ncbi:MAG: proline dehydrogenase family protein [Candidatus Falkowbacteria bacterium]